MCEFDEIYHCSFGFEMRKKINLAVYFKLLLRKFRANEKSINYPTKIENNHCEGHKMRNKVIGTTSEEKFGKNYFESVRDLIVGLGLEEAKLSGSNRALQAMHSPRYILRAILKAIKRLIKCNMAYQD